MKKRNIIKLIALLKAIIVAILTTFANIGFLFWLGNKLPFPMIVLILTLSSIGGCAIAIDYFDVIE